MRRGEKQTNKHKRASIRGDENLLSLVRRNLCARANILGGNMEIKIAHHASIIYGSERPEHQNLPQSNELWLKLRYFRAVQYLFEMKSRYGQHYGYSKPQIIS